MFLEYDLLRGSSSSGRSQSKCIYGILCTIEMFPKWVNLWSPVYNRDVSCGGYFQSEWIFGILCITYYGDVSKMNGFLKYIGILSKSDCRVWFLPIENSTRLSSGNSIEIEWNYAWLLSGNFAEFEWNFAGLSSGNSTWSPSGNSESDYWVEFYRVRPPSEKFAESDCQVEILLESDYRVEFSRVRLSSGILSSPIAKWKFCRVRLSSGILSSLIAEWNSVEFQLPSGNFAQLSSGNSTEFYCRVEFYGVWLPSENSFESECLARLSRVLSGVLSNSGPLWEFFRVRVLSGSSIEFGSQVEIFSGSGPERELIQVPSASSFRSRVGSLGISMIFKSLPFFFSFEEGSGNIFLKMFWCLFWCKISCRPGNQEQST